jgi:hypothetical protein
VKDMRRGDALEFDRNPEGSQPNKTLESLPQLSYSVLQHVPEMASIMPHNAAYPGRAGEDLVARWIR